MLDALLHNKLPKNVACWPEDEPVATLRAHEENQARLLRKQAKYDRELIEELEADLDAGITSHNNLTGPGIIPIANAASSSSNPVGEPSTNTGPVLTARPIIHGFDEEEMEFKGAYNVDFQMAA